MNFTFWIFQQCEKKEVGRGKERGKTGGKEEGEEGTIFKYRNFEEYIRARGLPRWR